MAFLREPEYPQDRFLAPEYAVKRVTQEVLEHVQLPVILKDVKSDGRALQTICERLPRHWEAFLVYKVSTMTKKATKTDGKASFGGYTFINYTLSSDDKKKLAQAASSDVFPLSLIGDLVAEGYKFSMSYDDQNHTFIATLTDAREDSPFHKHMLSGRGAIAVNAFCSLCYKHLFIAESDWSKIADPKANGGGDFG